MSASDVVRARIDPKIKSEAIAVLDTLGLSVSDAFRMLLTRVARDKALPFELTAPNAATVLAMQEARRGSLKSFGSVEALMSDLNADD